MRLIAPLFLCMIGAAAGAVLASLFGSRGTGVRIGALAGLFGGFAGLLVRDALDVELGGQLVGTIAAVATGALLTALAANLVALLRGGRRAR